MAGGRFARRAWGDLGGDPALLGRVEPPGTAVPLPSSLAVGELAFDSVAVASLAADLVRAVREPGGEVAAIRVDPGRVAGSYRSERVFRWNGRAVDAWSGLSGFWEAADGWVRTHGNYPHHAQRLRTLLGLAADAGPGEVRRAIAGRGAAELEDAAASTGAVVGAVRDAATWAEHPQARAIAGRPLVVRRRLGPAAPRPWPERGPLPLAGIRVLDLTRVIAGPVATRDLAFAGAQVLRVDDPRLPEIGWQHLDTGQGKRSATLDLRAPDGLAALHGLIERADVVVTGYRPGSLDRYGLAPEALAERHPGVVVGQVSAWDTAGPWRGRRGFDSIVQAVIGIALAESGDGRTPGALPAQALDHSAGHLLAAAIMVGLCRQRAEGGSHAVSVALARVGHELLSTPGATEPPAVPGEAPTVTGAGPAGEITCAAPALAFRGAPAAYAWVGHPWGADPARWDKS
ncbi:CoA transferase [Thermopolyspora sp. NPDC052614]|uniref:CoA transferase n=1 Tax=Thermopolyspora sp. NPDC052614 TaxID=3155682 RepID=UPI00343940B2